MASTPQGDIVNNRFPKDNYTFASVASNGANGLLPVGGPLPWNVRIRNAWFTPTGASLANTQSGSYRKLTLVNLGSAGTGTVTMASLAVSATGASLVPVAMAVDTTQTFASGIPFAWSQVTVGAAEANGTVLVAGTLTAAFEIV